MSNFSFPNLSLNRLLMQARQILMSGTAAGVSSPANTSTSGNVVSSSLLQAALKDGKLPLSMLLSTESLRLPPQEASLFLKETMKLPNEIRFFLLMLALESSPAELKSFLSQNLKQLIEENLGHLTVPMEEVQELLAQATKEGAGKLIRLLQGSSASQTRSGQQLIDMAATLGKLSEKVKASPTEALETLMLLYIPWYPLATQQKLELSFEMGEGEGEGGERDVSMVIFLETNTLGRFKIVVQEVDPLQVVVKIAHENVAKEVIPHLETQLNEFLANEGLPAAVFDAECIHPQQLEETTALLEEKPEQALPEGPEPEQSPAVAGFKKATRQSDHKQITVQPGNHISLLVVNCAYTLARFIFEADEKNRLLQKSQ